ncbi:MAG: DUF4190 domain-containing protein [Anaerolineae bacterium]|nr:DUF4190 domain-containing protein [Anaerolineae bacterium]
MIICPNCGAENPEERDLCQSCGAPLREPAPAPATLPYAVPASPTTSGLAAASLIMGVLGWFMLPLVGNVLAIIFGHMAKNEIARSGGRLTGDGLATVGLVLGYIGVGVWALGILASVLFGVGICGCGTCTTFLAALSGTPSHR